MTESKRDALVKSSNWLGCSVPAKEMYDGELILDWDERVFSKDPDDLDTLNVGWFWVWIEAVQQQPNVTGERQEEEKK